VRVRVRGDVRRVLNGADRQPRGRRQFDDQTSRGLIVSSVTAGRGRTVASERLATTFSPAVLRGLAKEDIEAVKPRVSALAQMDNVLNDTTLGEAFDMAFRHLSDNYRNEYYFKTQLISKIVFGRHSPRTAAAMLEVPMGRSCADLMILNGTSSIYEIKTDYDDFGRLASQIESYTTRADLVHVVVSESRGEAAERRLPSTVGVLVLRASGALATVRPSASHLDLMQSDHLFQLLRTAEAADIMCRVTGLDVAGLPTGRAWPLLREQFAQLATADAHREVVDQLRRRGTHAGDLLSQAGFPKSLRGAAYATQLSRRGTERLLERMLAPVSAIA
jgi:hypothetical protein